MDNQEKINAIKNWLGSGSINLFGKPFAGKDNQGQRLMKLIGGNVLGGGDILRNSVIPPRSQQALKDGELIPSQDYVDIVLPYLSKSEFADQPLFLSAVGRWHGEEDGVIAALQACNHNLKAVIYLSINDDDAFNRWRIRETFRDRPEREDDTEKVLVTRLDEFNQKTMPVIDYYRQLGLLIEIDGTKTRDQVTSALIDSLYQKALHATEKQITY